MLRADDRLLRQIAQEAERAYPHECCGFLLGAFQGEERLLTELLPAQNTSETGERYHRFLTTPEQMLHAELYARQHHLDILGFYHSHPDAPAVPSEYDRSHALPVYSYVIASVRGGQTADIRSYLLEPENYQQFTEETIS